MEIFFGKENLLNLQLLDTRKSHLYKLWSDVVYSALTAFLEGDSIK